MQWPNACWITLDRIESIQGRHVLAANEWTIPTTGADIPQLDHVQLDRFFRRVQRFAVVACLDGDREKPWAMPLYTTWSVATVKALKFWTKSDNPESSRIDSMPFGGILIAAPGMSTAEQSRRVTKPGALRLLNANAEPHAPAQFSAAQRSIRIV